MRQKWGQNFLVDESVADRIVAALPERSERLLEIGPGKGMLTERLLARKEPMTAVELDAVLAEELGRRWPALEIVREDFLKWPLPDWPARSVDVIGNLPYSAGNAILRKFLAWPAWRRAVVMVQKEVADRIVAPADCADYGILSLAVQGLAEARKLFDVRPGAFRPAPKVVSAVVELSPRPASLIEDEDAFFRVVHAGFGQRRKTLLNALSHGLEMEKPPVEAALKRAGIDPIRRAETLTLDDFNRLAALLFPAAKS